MKKFFTLLIFISAISGVNAGANTEKEKIEALLCEVENSKLIFIRNGSEYNSKAARDHLQRKLNRAGDKIKTAEQFIEHIASKSYFSNEPYYIKYEDGHKVRAADWLYKRLKIIEKRTHAKERK